MNKKFKRLSAVILAVVMMLGSTVMASAATSYPQTTLGGTKVPSTDEFSIVLSYDTTHFEW